ncbi:hypothetical protein JXL19_03800 [bacterium]|nr:hypothetical protein [bacterium]
MYYLLLIHILLIVWLSIDGLGRRINIIPWIMGTMILGPVILPYYISRRPLKAGESREGRWAACFFKCLAVFWALMWAAIGIWGGKLYTEAVKNEALEYRLAVISSKGRICENSNETVTRFRSLLEQLSENYIEDPRQLANISLITHKKMKERGMDVSLLNIMEGLNQIMWPEDGKKRSYSEYAFAYSNLRCKGISHSEAIDDLQAIANGY